MQGPPEQYFGNLDAKLKYTDFRQNTQLWGSEDEGTELLLPEIDPYGLLFVIMIQGVK